MMPCSSLRVLCMAFAAMVMAFSVRADVVSAAPDTATAGRYRMDPYHASLSFQIRHLGLSNYIARFTRFDATLQWDPANPAGSSIEFRVEPASIRTDFSGDYRKSVPDSRWSSFDEALSRDPKFLNTDSFPKASFISTHVEPLGTGRWRVTGHLSLLGQSNPVVFEASLVGQTAKHMGTGRPALGLSASGAIQRSAFGMDYLLDPPLLGDEVVIRFEGEFSGEP